MSCPPLLRWVRCHSFPTFKARMRPSDSQMPFSFQPLGLGSGSPLPPAYPAAGFLFFAGDPRAPAYVDPVGEFMRGSPMTATTRGGIWASQVTEPSSSIRAERQAPRLDPPRLAHHIASVPSSAM